MFLEPFLIAQTFLELISVKDRNDTIWYGILHSQEITNIYGEA